MKVVFFGTPPFAAATLAHLVEQGIEIVGVVTRPDKPVGRSDKLQSTAVKRVTQKLLPSLPIFQPVRASAPEVAAELEKLGADLFVVVAYGQIIKENLLEMPPLGCINVHASLLPRWRGAAPIQRSIMAGDEVTGVTIMHMAKGLDTGDMIRTAEVKIGEKTYGELEEALCHAGCGALVQTIHDLESGKAERAPQNDDLATYAKKVTQEDGLVSFDHPAKQHLQQIRGVTPKPGAWCWVEIRGKRKRMKILRASVSDGNGTAGALIEYGKEALIVACRQQALYLEEVQLEGKRAMAAPDFMRGFQQSDIQFHV